MQARRPCFRRNTLTEQVRKDLDALDLLMQDHRELESLFSEFAYLRQNGRETAAVIAAACAELRVHDTLETDIFYADVDEATDDEEIQDLLDEAEDEHDVVLDLLNKLEQSLDRKEREKYFAIIAEHVKHHVVMEETELFPMVRELEQLDLDLVAAAMKRRRAELSPELDVDEADEETV
jgi:hypothetical protein